MYFKILAKIDPTKPDKDLDEDEKLRLKNFREDIVADFLTKKHHFNFVYDDIKCVRSEKEGFIYMISTKFNGKVSHFEFFVSNFEFGPPRQFENDHRFAFSWKEHMALYLKSFAPQYLSKYFEDWNEEYVKYRNVLREKVPAEMQGEFDENTESGCKELNFDKDDCFAV